MSAGVKAVNTLIPIMLERYIWESLAHAVQRKNPYFFPLAALFAPSRGVFPVRDFCIPNGGWTHQFTCAQTCLVCRAGSPIKP